MFRQIKLLLKVQLVNAFGLNEARHSGDPRKRRTRIALMCVMALAALVLCGYAAAICFALAKYGAGEAVPTLLALVAGVAVLMLTLFRAGPVLFDLHSYEQLIALPLRPTAIVVSRFLRMYASNAALALALFAPGTVAAGAVLRPGFGYWAMMLLGALVVPLIPMALATLLGALVYGISARMRRRNLAMIVLTLLAVLALVAGEMLLASLDEMDGAQLLHLIPALLERIGSCYPPAKWFAACVRTGNLAGFLALAAGSLALFALVAGGIGSRFHAICAALSARAAGGGFVLQGQRRRSAFAALWLRELRRYAASPVYVVNTIIGGLMAVLLGLGALVALQRAPELRWMVASMGLMRFVPFALALLFSISPSTTCAISLEGRQWWQVKCLPVGDRMVLGAKLALHLTLALPCWLVSSALLAAALRPSGLDLLWLLVVPLAYILLAGALGLRMNLAMPSFTWESEAQPVKQSRAVSFTMLAGFLAALLPVGLMQLLPAGFGRFVPAIAALGAVAGAVLLYRGCLRVELKAID